MTDNNLPSNENEDDNDASPLPAEEVLQEIIIAMVDYPKDVKITTDINNTNVNEQRLPTKKLTISVNTNDLGKIIGKSGTMTEALRRVIGTIGAKERFWILIDVNTENGTSHHNATHGARPQYQPQQQPPPYGYQPQMMPYGYQQPPPGYFQPPPPQQIHQPRQNRFKANRRG